MGKKKWLRGVMAMAVAGSLLISAAPGSLQAPKASAAVKLTGKTKKVAYRNTFVGKHGRLRVKGTKLVDKKGKAVQLRGISSHGINWDVGEPFVNEKALRMGRQLFSCCNVYRGLQWILRDRYGKPQEAFGKDRYSRKSRQKAWHVCHH